MINYPMALRSRRDYLLRIYNRYHKVTKTVKSAMLEEFCKVCGYQRDYASWLLNRPLKELFKEKNPRQRSFRYNQRTLSILEKIWQVADYPWSVRLKALLNLWMPWIKTHYHIDATTQRQLLSISARQIDRRLKAKKILLKRKRYGTTKPGTLLKHQIPIQTQHWNIDQVGYLEIDTVAHCGNSLQEDFIYTLNATDIKTTWVERVAVMGKGQKGIFNALLEIQRRLPFPLKGIDSDNGSEFINHHLYQFCRQSLPPIQFTRSRPYQKQDNAYIEEKNWTHVRKILGWSRYDTPRALETINQLYRHDLCYWHNFFQPSTKCFQKIRKGSRLIRRFDSPKTPFQRLLDGGQLDPDKLQQLQKLFTSLNPFQLSASIDRQLHRLRSLTDLPLTSQNDFNPKPIKAHSDQPLSYSFQSPWRNWTFSSKLKRQQLLPL